MIIDERTSRSETVAAIARSIMTAGRTAPKSKGVDLIEIVTITGETVARLAEATRRAGEENGMQFFCATPTIFCKRRPSFWSARAARPWRSTADIAVL